MLDASIPTLLILLLAVGYIYIVDSIYRRNLNELLGVGQLRPLNIIGATLAACVWPLTLPTIVIWASLVRE